MKKQQSIDTEVLEKLRSFCAYRERASSEVRARASELSLAEERLDAVIDQLEQEGFIDDQRFAELYARSKFRQNAWGKYKIRAGLAEKRLSAGTIEIALAELDQEEYEIKLRVLVEKFAAQDYPADRIFQKMKAKGFEGELVYSHMQSKGLV